MKKIIILLLICLCSTSYGQNVGNKKKMRKKIDQPAASQLRLEKFTYGLSPNPCLVAFKDNFFFSYMSYCFKGTSAVAEIKKVDVGNPYDGFPFELHQVTDSLANVFYKSLPKPQLCDECKPDQNYFLAQGLHYYSSPELDRVARSYISKYAGLCSIEKNK